ncbi:GAF and ANTAR domain-containing protein [Mycolicibacterium komossense]|uniref:GAF and ANTAR domain-containing protein n=1 Tax=Mycolicibacterium komossense TaxID=1779 RepID=A0ABT3CDX4_9MYCO|nr:GAF and ANTAR domain-containing protein [Mycolicibacterium komossense]MCV7227678.1 GAF and ANTAR domain-containing protein [Mycolicibacterium komossense]
MCDSDAVRSESNGGLAVQMAELARQLAMPLSLPDVLAGVTKSVLEVIPGADVSGFLLFTKGEKYETHAATSDVMFEIDRLQVKHGEGPCIEAAIDELIVRTDDFQREQRWPNYSADVLKLGLRSALSFKLYTTNRNAGALNIFAFEPNAFDAEDEAVGSVLAAHAAAAILASRQGDQLQSALTNRDLIGQAKGIIMERYNVDAVRAFEMLRELSQSSNEKLVEVAVRVIDTRGS